MLKLKFSLPSFKINWFAVPDECWQSLNQGDDYISSQRFELIVVLDKNRSRRNMIFVLANSNLFFGKFSIEDLIDSTNHLIDRSIDDTEKLQIN